MIKFLLFFLIILVTNFNAIGRDIGETEITTEGGIEVFQDEKYYLLKKNVEIISDELKLNGQVVKVFFEEGLYDVIKLIANDNVSFISKPYNISGEGNKVKLEVKKQKIFIKGVDSKLYLEDTEMLSDGEIEVDNLNNSFFIIGLNSKLNNDNIYIIGSKINGNFEIINGKRGIANLTVEDDKKLSIKTDDTLMFSKKAIYDKKNSIIELFDEVQINRGDEIITGDYGIFNTTKKSYKVSSNDSKKVKAIIVDSDE